MVLKYGHTAKAPVNLRILGGFAIFGDGSVDGIRNRILPDTNILFFKNSTPRLMLLILF